MYALIPFTALLGAQLAAAIVSREVVTIRKTITETIHASPTHAHTAKSTEDHVKAVWRARAGFNPINGLPVTETRHHDSVQPSHHTSAGYNPINDLPVTESSHHEPSKPSHHSFKVAAGYNPINSLPVTPTRHEDPSHPTPKAPPSIHAKSSAHPSHPTASPQHRLLSPQPDPVDTYASTALRHHNVHRANHSSPALTWSDSLASIANDIASTCVYAHNLSPGGGGYGQNIAAGVAPANISAIITDMFYNGEEPYYASLYGQAQPSMNDFEKWGHFSQIVWKSTTSVGCATVHCGGGLQGTGWDVSPWFTVCNYKPPGNMAGKYGSNVLRPLGHPTVGR